MGRGIHKNDIKQRGPALFGMFSTCLLSIIVAHDGTFIQQVALPSHLEQGL